MFDSSEDARSSVEATVDLTDEVFRTSVALSKTSDGHVMDHFLLQEKEKHADLQKSVRG